MTPDTYGHAYATGFDRTVRLLVSRGAPRDAAQEAAQAAWARGWERVGQLHNESAVVNWVNTIAINLYRRTMRSQSGMTPLPEISSGCSVNLVALDLDRVLRLCNPSERALLEQKCRGLSTRDIAHQHGLTETAVRIRLLRARRAAKSRLATKTASPPRRSINAA